MKIGTERVGIFDPPDIVNKTSAQLFYLVVQGLTQNYNMILLSVY